MKAMAVTIFLLVAAVAAPPGFAQVSSAVEYSTFFGGEGSDGFITAQIAPDGSYWLLANTTSTAFPAAISPNVIHGGGGGFDVLLAHLSADGQELLELIIIGGSDSDAGLDLFVAADDTIVVAGETHSDDFPVANAAQSDFAGGGLFAGDAFLLKIAPDRSLMFSTYFGGGDPDNGDNGFETFERVIVDASGRIYALGLTESSDYPATLVLGARPCLDGGAPFGVAFMTDGVIARFSASGALEYAACIGGDNRTLFEDFAVGANGEWLIVGSTRASNYPLAAPLQARDAGADGILTVISGDTPAITFSSPFGGDDDDFIYATSLAQNGDLLFAGLSESSDLPVTPGAPQTGQAPSIGNERDMLVGRLDLSTSQIVFATYLGGDGDDTANAVKEDSNGDVWVVGTTRSTDFPTIDAISGFSGDVDGAISRLNGTGTAFTFSTYLGGSARETLREVLLLAPGRAAVLGSTSSPDYPLVGAFQNTLSGTGDGFLSVLDIDGDQDDVVTPLDNCRQIANTDQTDTDSDGYGNACDADFTNDCVVNVQDLGLLRAGFFGSDAVLDLNNDGVVNVLDLGILRSAFFAAPGPSGTTSLCADAGG